MTKLIDAVKTAMDNGVEKPILRFGDYKFVKAKKYPCMYVSFAGLYLSAVSLENGAFRNVAAIDKHMTEIQNILEDIEPYMEQHGKETGTCCICGRTLTNEESVRLMIGPICGGRWGFFNSLLQKEQSAEQSEARLAPTVKDIPQDKFDFSDL